MKKIDLFVYVAHNDNGPTPNQYFFFFGEVGKVSCSFKTSPNVMSKGFYFFSREFLTLWFVEQSRHSPSYITAGHFDAVPGELRLKAFETRLMTTFLAICLRSVWSSVDAARRTADPRCWQPRHPTGVWIWSDAPYIWILNKLHAYMNLVLRTLHFTKIYLPTIVQVDISLLRFFLLSCYVSPTCEDLQNLQSIVSAFSTCWHCPISTTSKNTCDPVKYLQPLTPAINLS